MTNVRNPSQLGFTDKWDVDDLASVTEAHREIYAGLKGRTDSISTIPGAIQSIQRLLDMGYSLTDIGAMLGVTRERVRQWCAQYALQRRAKKGAMFRLWDEGLGQFRACNITEFIKQYNRSHVEFEAAKLRARQAGARARHVIVLRTLYKILQRPIGVGELLETLGQCEAAVTRYWGYGGGRSNTSYVLDSYKAAIDKLYEYANVPLKPSSARGDAVSHWITGRPLFDFVNTLRVERGWTWARLASEIGITAITLKFHLDGGGGGKFGTRATTLERLAVCFEIHLETLEALLE